MSQDDIIAMAQEAGITFVTEFGVASATPEFLASFYALAAAAERRKHQADIERWKSAAATAEKWRGLALARDCGGRTVQRVQDEAAAAEREACAQIAQATVCDTHIPTGIKIYGTRAAQAIRARGKP